MRLTKKQESRLKPVYEKFAKKFFSFEIARQQIRENSCLISQQSCNDFLRRMESKGIVKIVYSWRVANTKWMDGELRKEVEELGTTMPDGYWERHDVERKAQKAIYFTKLGRRIAGLL
jgi:hypothetical protein